MSRKDLEHFTYEQEKKPQVIVKKKGGFWGKFFTLILGFILGVVGALGGVIGGGYYLSKHKTVGEVLDMANISYDKYSQYISDEYSEKIVWDAIGSLVDTAKGLDEYVTLGDLAKISPYITQKAFEAAEGAYNDYGVDLNMNGDLLDIPLVQLNQHLTDCIKATPLGDIVCKFGEEGNINKVVIALCYGIENKDYYIENGVYKPMDGKKFLTINDFTSEVLHERLNALPIDILMDIPKTDNTMLALAYGAPHRYTIDPSTKEITMSPLYYTYDGTCFYDDYGEVLDATATPVDGVENAYILNIAERKNDDGKVIEKAKTHLVIKGDDEKFYAYEQTVDGLEHIPFQKTTVGMLQADAMSLINHILLKDALNITYKSHPVLIALCYGEEKVDFNYTYDTDGNKTGITEINEPRSIGDFKKNGTTIIDNIYLTDIVPAKSDNKMVTYLLYGKAGVHYSYDEHTGEYTPLQKRVALYETSVYNEYGELITGATANGVSSYTIDGKTYTLTAIQDTTVQAKINLGTEQEPNEQTLDLQAYFVSDENGVVNYTRTQLKDLSQANSPLLYNMTGRLTLGDVLDIENDDMLLFNLKDVVIQDLAKAVKELTVLQVFGGENGSIDYLTFEETDIKDGVYTTRHDIVYTVYQDDTGKYYLYDTQKVYTGSFVDWDGKPVSGEDRILTKIWWYLLHDYTKPNDPTAVIDCPLLEFEKLADNMTHNMKIVTLNQLNADKMVETGSAVRDKKLVKEILMGDEEVYAYIDPNTGYPAPHPETGEMFNTEATLYKYYQKVVVNGGTATMGEMTVPEMMHYLEVAIDEYNKLLAEKNASS